MSKPLGTKNGPKPQRSALDELLTNFDPFHYNQCKKWMASDWFAAVRLRYLLHIAQYYADDSLASHQFISNALSTIRSNPTSLGQLDRTIDPSEAAVRDMTVGELMEDLKSWAPELSDLRLVSGEDDMETTNKSLYEVCIAKSSYPGDWLRVLVDITKTDENLITDFAKWLRQKRAESDDPPRLKSQPPLSESTLREWSNNRVLGFIDLELSCKSIGWELSNEEMGNELFPDEADIDVLEKIRRTVRPLAEAILTKRNLNALETAARTNRF